MMDDRNGKFSSMEIGKGKLVPAPLLPSQFSEELTWR
jgi:hypothetical protein